MLLLDNNREFPIQAGGGYENQHKFKKESAKGWF
jgi:hypothetical protein